MNLNLKKKLTISLLLLTALAASAATLTLDGRSVAGEVKPPPVPEEAFEDPLDLESLARALEDYQEGERPGMCPVMPEAPYWYPDSYQPFPEIRQAVMIPEPVIPEPASTVMLLVSSILLLRRVRP